MGLTGRSTAAESTCGQVCNANSCCQQLANMLDRKQSHTRRSRLIDLRCTAGSSGCSSSLGEPWHQCMEDSLVKRFAVAVTEC